MEPWRPFAVIEFATLELVDWLNHRRLREFNGNIPPVEFKDAATPELSGVAAGLTPNGLR